MRLLILLAILSVTLIVWFVKDRHREFDRLREDARLRVARQERLDEAASAVEVQAQFGRTVADRIRTSSVAIPAALCASVDAVVVELDGVARDLRSSCVTVRHAPVRRTLLHR